MSDLLLLFGLACLVLTAYLIYPIAGLAALGCSALALAWATRPRE